MGWDEAVKKKTSLRVFRAVKVSDSRSLSLNRASHVLTRLGMLEIDSFSSVWNVKSSCQNICHETTAPLDLRNWVNVETHAVSLGRGGLRTQLREFFESLGLRSRKKVDRTDYVTAALSKLFGKHSLDICESM